MPPTGADGVRRDALARAGRYPWPGNIRELRNVIYEALVYKRAGTELLLSDLHRPDPPAGRAFGRRPLVNRSALAAAVGSPGFQLAREVAGLERAALELALTARRRQRRQAARLLGSVGRGQAADPGGTVRAMMKRLGLRR